MIAGTEGAIRYIDIAKCMSMVNRKLMRQQGVWHVLAARAYAQNKPGGASPAIGCAFQVAIRGAPRSWVTRNSLVKMFEFWKDQQAKAYSALGTDSVKPKWQDFKVYLSEDHIAGTELTPTSGDQFGAQDAYNLGEWIHSKIVYEEVDGGNTVVQYEPEIFVIGPNASPTVRVGTIAQYAESRAKPVSPDPSLPPNIANNIFQKGHDALDEQIEGIVENLADDNDTPPYDVDTYPGGASNAIDPQTFAMGANSTGSTLARFINLNGFSAPNGLLEVQCQLDKAEPDVGEFWLQLVIGKREAY